ncbi:sigma-70 family RNA polymerase sigma factor [Longispora albida]|uniref:sigma-70 family RNA polymerase sigma factor n=1 Tax=Longispora albida TaxID=203523 RepID=UPI00037049C1|nr:sigma-70 family RNA polymerase sigma factor [Longispora albida]
MENNAWLAGQFEENRSHLRAVAYRMLGSAEEADDAVQEAWLRLTGADVSGVNNLRAWLTTVVARVSLNQLRGRTRRGESPLLTEPVAGHSPEHEALMADSVGLALLVVLDSLNPAERLAFVLHDLFAVPFDEIAPILGRTVPATRQLASRARRRVRGVRAEPSPDQARQHEVVAAFLAASRAGDFAGLLALLDPEAVVLADSAAVMIGAQAEVRGRAEVAETFCGRAAAAELAVIDGLVGAVWAPGGEPRVVFAFTLHEDRVAEIRLIADPDEIRTLDVELLSE